MNEFLQCLFVASFWIFGFHYAFKSGEILGGPGDYIRANLAKWIVKPTIGCVKCMASVHGTIFFLIFVQSSIMMWIVFVVCLCGLNYILDALGYE
jgi:hypothetical protein